MIINRISAGEVVESPFSIVKELIDNSLDAGATKITVSIKNGGIDQIVVKDNGKGIDKDDMIKAFLPHATSKIKDITDLEAISTLGFRGEALASISNVSQCLLTTKTENSDMAFSLEVDGGRFGEINPAVAEKGTTIEVNNLFFNTPARRKFLRKPKQEETQITNILSRYILSNPKISFKYYIDSKLIYQTNGTNLLDAINCVYGIETTQNIMPVEKSFGNLVLSGYVSKLGYSKPNTSYQTLIINGRYVIDDIVSKAVYMAFEEYLMPRQFPFYVLNLTMPAVDVDVNVHPSKMNVKFSNPGNIYDLVNSATSSAVFKFLHPDSPVVDNSNAESIQSNLINTDVNSLKEIELEPVDFKLNSGDPNIVLRQHIYEPITIFDKPLQQGPENKTFENVQPFEKSTNQNENYFEKDFDNDKVNSNPVNNDTTQPIKYDSNQDDSNYIRPENMSDYKIIGEIFNEFIVLEKGDVMMLMDFHAGHERLNYDKFRKMVDSRQLVVQDLLIPYCQVLSEQEIQFVLNLKDELKSLGFEIQTNANTLEITTIPMLLKDINLKSFVDDLIHDFSNLKPSINNEIKHYLMQKACKSSVKSGMILQKEEIEELLKNLDESHPVLLCPHGRPVVTTIKKSEIEKWFKRIV